MMHLHVRSLAVLTLLAPATVLAWQVSSSGVEAQVPPAAPCVVFPGAAQAPGGQAPADAARVRVIQVVTIRDNNAPSPQDAFDRRQSRWDYDPDRLVVRRGELVEFRNPGTNSHEHTVTSYIRPGGPAATTLAVGTLFDSSPPPSTTHIPVGGSCILDTGAIPLPPNPQGGLSQNIGYFCRLHPWMNAEITIVAPPNS
jgi:plastocyanin